jgi:hypothetical protein
VIETADGDHLLAVPFEETLKLNQLRGEVEDRPPNENVPAEFGTLEGKIVTNMKYDFLIYRRHNIRRNLERHC